MWVWTTRIWQNCCKFNQERGTMPTEKNKQCNRKAQHLPSTLNTETPNSPVHPHHGNSNCSMKTIQEKSSLVQRKPKLQSIHFTISATVQSLHENQSIPNSCTVHISISNQNCQCKGVDRSNFYKNIQDIKMHATNYRSISQPKQETFDHLTPHIAPPKSQFDDEKSKSNHSQKTQIISIR